MELHPLRRFLIITQNELKKLLHYCPETGSFTWNDSWNYRAKANNLRAGTLTKAGYIQINIKSKSELAHRIAWLYMTGSLPAKPLDHIDGNRSNNRWENLREVTVSENMRNRLGRGKYSRFLGVSFMKDTGKFLSQMKVNGKTSLIGFFSSETEAFAAYLCEVAELQGEASASILYNRHFPERKVAIH